MSIGEKENSSCNGRLKRTTKKKNSSMTVTFNGSEPKRSLWNRARVRKTASISAPDTDAVPISDKRISEFAAWGVGVLLLWRRHGMAWYGVSEPRTRARRGGLLWCLVLSILRRVGYITCWRRGFWILVVHTVGTANREQRRRRRMKHGAFKIKSTMLR